MADIDIHLSEVEFSRKLEAELGPDVIGSWHDPTDAQIHAAVLRVLGLRVVPSAEPADRTYGVEQLEGEWVAQMVETDGSWAVYPGG